MSYVFPVLGYDIGGTKIAVCLGNSDGKILDSKRIDNRDRAPAEVLEDMYLTGKKLLKKAGVKKEYLRAIGIGAPGPMDIPNGLLLTPTNMKKWDRVPVRDFIGDHFKVRTYFDNDANAGALAEWFFGVGKGCKNLIYLTMSTGIGGGIIANGHLIHGKTYQAGEVGHIVLDRNGPECNCGIKGCYEAYCGGLAVAKRMKRELAGQPEHPMIKYAGGKLKDIDMKVLINALKKNDDYAVKLWDELCLRHAQAIGTYINIFSPEIIVMGTIAVAAGKLFMKPLKKYLPKFSWDDPREKCRLMTSTLGKHIGEYSGICVALNGLYEMGEWKPS